MKHISSSLFHSVAVVTLCTALLSPAVEARSAQPNMHTALDALRAAKTSANPIEDLKTARGRLGVALHNKAGYRVEAMGIVDQAIAEFKAGHRRAAYKLVDEAITKTEKGVTSGHR